MPPIYAAIALAFGVRFVRSRRRRRHRRSDDRVVLFGAGRAGTLLLRSMLTDPDWRCRPVGLLDDDPGKHRRRLHGVPILGGRDDIGTVLRRTHAGTLIFAVANAGADLVRDVRERTVAAGAEFKVVPSVTELLDHPVAVDDIRDVQVADLLGRHQIDTGLDGVAGFLTGRRVLVTGAGGSIGSELCRQIHRFHPAELIMLDRDESALQATQLSIDARAGIDDPSIVLADLRDAAHLRQIFHSRRPEVVFHAAALKHLALLQRFPGEAFKTNVLGTLNMLAAAEGVQRFVNISTDKAADPTSVLGYSKRVTERLTAWTAGRHPGTFLSVRFGNVLGSRGSVFTTFTAQIADGGPVTVTHPDVTRYFMTVQEAVHLVVQAAAIGRDGEALVLDMGEPVRIAEVARQMVELRPHPVDIRYTGLRPGEKLTETLFGAGEVDTRPFHPLISHVEVPALSAADVARYDPDGAPENTAAGLAELCALPSLTGAGG
ncbi:NDP-sugar epimerase, includes UDP-GlcNAc-inverting 4,6-dehydratase FlaA1 and capsular polysaccharide biosynthesis protein EpsC [Actinoplanes derwentensis]|uniref:NDP-sugar epimerase, includes UDP-GlcNAc-inverting 4,6-dehydratase FlaA1 and capsular polysaccharide biosynthesis protein EpsC n=2 Tax=Actinoplanes derwentensis TaxID=113562 RepID=A0A1H1UWG9_9ACTN|nr:polysaccharide biosynthesis protein [Actinoplanes derwentensis]SDS76803.1 NDP-sugar epimerase, includes UDP-GlcNAc-inverting 4,6-dehydratase FlaA1 and capsular polysaccharide biosynthesis protein EpsC [Actinoplanes derwentensis]